MTKDLTYEFNVICDVYDLSPREFLAEAADYAFTRNISMREAFLCLDCRRDTSDEYYMVHDELWLEANPDDDGMLCVLCLEARLGRQLTAADFTDAPVNDTEESSWYKTKTLVDRLTRV